MLLGPDAKCAIHKHPVNWVLYNKIVDMLRTRHPLGKGNYLPAMSLAKDLLMENNHGGCLLQLVFLTDGAPSDEVAKSYPHGILKYRREAVSKRIASVARKFGSRLTIGAIAVGDGR